MFAINNDLGSREKIIHQFIQQFSQQLELLLKQLNLTQSTIYIAYSGGLDSTVLLHLFYQLSLSTHFPVQFNLYAIHVNHQLQTKSGEWAHQCKAMCDHYQIPLIIETANIIQKAGESLEALAREARYKIFTKYIDVNNLLVTAHQQDDQAETLLLQLFRGAGVHGLSAMPSVKSFAQGHLLRPLLNFSRHELHMYAKYYQLQWLDDPSNQDIQFDRNYLRQQIMPLLKARWPQLASTISRAAEHCIVAAEAINTQAIIDYAQSSGSVVKTLSVKKLLSFKKSRAYYVFRYWLQQLANLIPSQLCWHQFYRDVLNCKLDASPQFELQNYIIRRYRDDLYLYSKTHHQQLLQPLAFTEILINDLNQIIDLPEYIGQLKIEHTAGQGIAIEKIKNRKLNIRFRQHEGDALKKIFQHCAIPPWLRHRIPLIYADDELIAVVDYWYAPDKTAHNKDEAAICFKIK